MYDRILVVMDGSPTAEWALDEAIQLAQKLDSELVIARVIDNSYLMYGVGHIDVGAFTEVLVRQGNQIVAGVRAEVEKAGVHVHSVAIDGPIGTFDIGIAIEQAAHNVGVQVLVLGTHGYCGFQRLFLGSAAESVVCWSTLPVLLVCAEPTETSYAPIESLSNAVIA